jgi:hypothetical protein
MDGSRGVLGRMVAKNSIFKRVYLTNLSIDESNRRLSKQYEEKLSHDKPITYYRPRHWYLFLKKSKAGITKAVAGGSRLDFSFRIALKENHDGTFITCLHGPIGTFDTFLFWAIICFCLIEALYLALFSEYKSAAVQGMVLATILFIPFAIYENTAQKIMKSYIEVALEAKPYEEEQTALRKDAEVAAEVDATESNTDGDDDMLSSMR